MSYIERRYAKTEVRAVANSRSIRGYAAVFNSPTDELSTKQLGFREQVKPGCFARTIAERCDCRCLFNHNPNLILARTKSGTLKLAEDSRGLHFEADCANTSQANDVLELIRRGDVSQCSFSFVMKRDKWTTAGTSVDGVASRDLLDCDLLDVSPVTYPVYTDTEVNGINEQAVSQARSLLFPNGIPLECRNAIAFSRLPKVDQDIIAYQQRKVGMTDLDVMSLRLSEAWCSIIADADFE